MTETTEVQAVPEEKKKRMTDEDDGTVFIGVKPFMNYVTAVVMQFTTRNAKEVVLKTRGQFISKAVDIAEIVRGRFLKGQVELSNIDIGSEDFVNKEGRNIRVSTMAIALKRVA